MSKLSNQYRYPGINAFEEAQKDRFHGRRVESEQLCALLTQEKLTILYGKSGYGKTSLLNAGVRPLLLEKSAKSKRRYHPVSTRFNAYNGEESLLEKFRRQFGQAAAAIGMVPATHGVALPDTLWGIVRGYTFPTAAPTAVFVLLFDQFEEFFTYPPEQQQDFKDQLAELLYADYPHFLEQNEANLQAEQIAALAEPLEVRALFGIRADRMHELNRLADRLDKILHNLYELHALPRTEAEKAIVLPAALPQSEGFASAPFAFDRPALDRILDFLADAQGRVEANQLQILCDSFEQRTIVEKITRFSTDNLGDLQQVISNYYHHKIADIHPPETRLAVQRLCEEGLAMEGEPPIRLSLHEAQIARLFGVPPALLLRLVDLRLLRAEAGAGGGAVYELPHDTLLLPVLEAKRVRQEEMAAEAERVAAVEALRRAQEAETQAVEERRRAEEAERLKNEAVAAKQVAEKAENDIRHLLKQLEQEKQTAITEKLRADSIAETNHRQARRAYANDLAYKSQIALQLGDRTIAYRLAEFAHRYVDDDNILVTRALVGAWYYNDNPAHQPLPWASNLEGHSDYVRSVAFSPDGKRLATGSEDHTAKIWDLKTGKAILTLKEDSEFDWLGNIIKQSAAINSVAFSPDGNRLATGSGNKRAMIWDLESGEAILTLEGHSDYVRSVAFSPDGQCLATGSVDNTAKIWDLDSGIAVVTLEGHSSAIQSVAFSPDGKHLATGSEDNTAKIWDLKTGKAILTLEGHSDTIRGVAFSPDGKYLATGSLDNTAKIWDLKTGKAARTLVGNSEYICVAFSPDGQRLATGSVDKTAKIWDLKSGKVAIMFEGHSYTVMSVTFSPDGKRLATASMDNIAKVWDWETSKAALTLEHNLVFSVAFSPDGQRLVTGTNDYTAKIWDLETGKALRRLKGHSSHVYSVAFSPDGKRLATGSEDNTAKIWDMKTGKAILTLEGHSDYVISIAFSPDGKRLATASDDKTAKIWDLETGKAAATLEGHSSHVNSVAFSPDGKRLATGSSDNTAKIWDMKTGKAILTLEGHSSTVNSIAFSPDGKRLATGSSDNTAKIWDLETGKAAATLVGHTSYVNSVAFSPDGKRLATGCGRPVRDADYTAKIWDLETGKASLTLEGHSSPVNSVAFSPDGKRLATGSRDGTAKIWDFIPRSHLGVDGRANRLDGLTLPQLSEYGLENLLDAQPNNEATLLASGDIWQIAAFADLYTDKIAKSLPKKADYERAKRLYQACLASEVDKPYFEKKMTELEQVWKEKTE